MSTDDFRGHGWEYFRMRDRQLLRRLRKILEAERYHETEQTRVIAVVKRELDTMAEEAWRGQ